MPAPTATGMTTAFATGAAAPAAETAAEIGLNKEFAVEKRIFG
jgi:hypothetical protein